MTHLIRTIDAHVGGQPVRLIVDGVPPLGGGSLAARADRFTRRADHIRRALLRPPRGHDALTAALLSEPVSPGSHAALLCMDAERLTPLHGHTILAAATIALERGLIFTGDESTSRVVFDTLAGTAVADARVERRGPVRRVDSVAVTIMPCFVHAAGQAVRVGSRDVRVDIAFGGVFHAIVDTDALGIPVEAARLPELRRLAREVLTALNATGQVAHPVDPSLRGVAALTITSAPRDPEAHLRNVTITEAGAADPSPGVTGTAAAMAVLDAMGLLPPDQPFVHEGMSGALLHGRLVQRTLIGDRPAIVPEITGAAWITGEHTFVLDDDDPFREGYWLQAGG